jgi:alpha-L-fucosidase 2
MVFNMKKNLFLLLMITLCFTTQAQDNVRLWYEKPATDWVEALPTGNGRLGGMVFGGVNEELIQLNEGTLWSGGPRKPNVNPDASKYLKPIREALAKKEYIKAQELTKKMQGHYSESFMPLGDLRIAYRYPGKGQAHHYERSLDLDKAVVTTRFHKDGVIYTREVFTSFPDSVMVIRLHASKENALHLSVSLNSLLKPTITTEGSHELHMQGKAPARLDPNYYNPTGRESVLWNDTTGCNGMRFRTIVRAQHVGGRLSSDQNGLHIQDATEVVLYLTAATSFNGFDKCPDREGRDEVALAKHMLSKAVAKDLNRLKQDHIADHKSLFNRLNLVLEDTTKNTALSKLPSDLRLKLYAYGQHDPALEALYFQYGRYLLIASSRPGGSVANLQGIWNKEFRPPWSSNYTININTQMNYWPAESGNLAELHEPLLQFVRNLSKTGTLTAQEYYKAKGWVAHHNSDIWALSNAVGNVGDGDPVWANWYMGGAWLSQHLWEHYAFNQDLDYLRKDAYPYMKGAALFCLDWLIEKDGYLITSPSTTPENPFWHEGKAISVSEATTMDMAIIRDLFTNVIEASEALETDQKFRELLLKQRAKLFPYQIGAQGQLQEWSEDFKEVEPQHRHLSHLFGLHPGRDISPLTTPELAKATERTFELRGDEGTGWSKGWKINFAARLLNGNHAYKMIREIMKYVEPNAGGSGGTYPNFFDAHPPFQIDGNFGATAGFIEMLVQSHLKELHLLPALPDAWNTGKVTGIRARGNFEIDLHWVKGKLQKGQLIAHSGGPVRVRTSQPIRFEGITTHQTKEGGYYLTTFESEKGFSYLFFSSE